MKRRDKRKRRKKRDELKLKAGSRPGGISKATDRHLAPVAPAGTVRVTRDSYGKMYIKAPDGSRRRADKVDPAKLDWLSEGGG